ncbi:UNVERIFIED_CONTAM: hypothetical protein PYX00_000015 [Menopon gallinae]|uniref:CCHC-type domain-containing protein n=1 Tax=Menopon gallinae TaxID=328185 RepID=A0AAW2I8V4_9NEOP
MRRGRETRVVATGVEFIGCNEGPFRFRLVHNEMSCPEALKKLESQTAGKLHIGYTRCRFERHVSVLRCFKCTGFGHKAADCRRPEEEPSERKKHTDSGKCCSCVLKAIAGKKKELKADTLSLTQTRQAIEAVAHRTFDACCPVLMALRERYSTRYNYGNKALSGVPPQRGSICRKDVSLLFSKSRLTFEPVTAEDCFIAGSTGDVLIVAGYFSPKAETMQIDKNSEHLESHQEKQNHPHRRLQLPLQSLGRCSGEAKHQEQKNSRHSCYATITGCRTNTASQRSTITTTAVKST